MFALTAIIDGRAIPVQFEEVGQLDLSRADPK